MYNNNAATMQQRGKKTITTMTAKKGDETEHGSINVPGDGFSEGLDSEGAMMTKVTEVVLLCVQI